MGEGKAGPCERKLVAESTAFAEVEWFYTRAKGKVLEPGDGTAAERKAADAIWARLREVATFHRGALALRFTPGEWPASLTKAFGSWASLIVRLECAAHPSDGRASNDELEAAAVARLEKTLARTGRTDPEILRLEDHARGHVRAAVRAYLKIRGLGRSVLPQGVTL